MDIQGCKYCGINDSFYDVNVGVDSSFKYDNYTLTLSVWGNLIDIYVYDMYKDKEVLDIQTVIKYCPMCGTHL